MLRPLSPAGIHPPFARYSHGIEIPAGARLVVCSGQLGVAEDGSIPPGIEAQTERCFENIRAILREAGLDLGDIVRLNAYVSRREDLAGYMRVRDRHVGDPPPASTLMIVAGFARPEFLVEVEVIAAAKG
jgi:enamine deaminase RidA (YjgF/YER057c/UK114 family)